MKRSQLFAGLFLVVLLSTQVVPIITDNYLRDEDGFVDPEFPTNPEFEIINDDDQETPKESFHGKGEEKGYSEFLSEILEKLDLLKLQKKMGSI